MRAEGRQREGRSFAVLPERHGHITGGAPMHSGTEKSSCIWAVEGRPKDINRAGDPSVALEFTGMGGVATESSPMRS